MNKSSLLVLFFLVFSSAAVGQSWDELGRQIALLANEGRFKEEIPLLIKAESVITTEFGDTSKTNRYYLSVLNNLVGAYENAGEYAKANFIIKQILNITKHGMAFVIYGHDDSYSEALNSFSLIYQNMGDYESARDLSEQLIVLESSYHQSNFFANRIQRNTTAADW